MLKLLVLSVLFSKCIGSPFVMPLVQFSPLFKSVFIGIEPGSNLYVASNDNDTYLKGISIQSGDTTITLDVINKANSNGTASFFPITDGLTISTSNDYSVSEKLTGFIYVNTRKQADDPNFSVYVIKSNHMITISASNSTVVVLNTALKSENNMDPLKSSHISKINQSSNVDLHFHYEYPPTNWLTMSKNQFFNNPIYIDSFDDDGNVFSNTRTFFDTVEPLQINLDYWYFTANGPISMQIENKYIEDLNYNTTSVNTTGVIVNNNVYQQHVVNFEMDYTRQKTVGMLVTTSLTSDLNIYFISDGSALESSYNNDSNAQQVFFFSEMQATKLVVNSTSPLPGTFYCQYFGVSGDLLPVATITVDYTKQTEPKMTTTIITVPTKGSEPTSVSTLQTEVSTNPLVTTVQTKTTSVPTGSSTTSIASVSPTTISTTVSTTSNSPTTTASTTPVITTTVSPTSTVPTDNTIFTSTTTTTTTTTTTSVPTTTKSAYYNSLSLSIVILFFRQFM